MTQRVLVVASAMVACAAWSGCGTQDEIGAGPRRAMTSTATTDRSTPVAAGARARFHHVPAVRGLPIAEARRRIADAGDVPERGTRYVPVVRGRREVEVVARPELGTAVTAQFPSHDQPARRGQEVVLATAQRAIPTRPVVGLSELRWRTIRMTADRLIVLDRIAAGGDCLVLDHVQVAPPRGGVRAVRIWALNQSFPRRVACERVPRRVVLPAPDDWESTTVAWNAPLSSPRPDLVEQRRTRFVEVVVQPDRRSVVVGYREGGCERLAAASARSVDGKVRIALRLGVPRGPADGRPRVCTRDLRFNHVLLRLERPVPAGTRFVPEGRGRGDDDGRAGRMR